MDKRIWLTLRISIILLSLIIGGGENFNVTDLNKALEEDNCLKSYNDILNDTTIFGKKTDLLNQYNYICVNFSLTDGFDRDCCYKNSISDLECGEDQCILGYTACLHAKNLIQIATVLGMILFTGDLIETIMVFRSIRSSYDHTKRKFDPGYWLIVAMGISISLLVCQAIGILLCYRQQAVALIIFVLFFLDMALIFGEVKMDYSPAFDNFYNNIIDCPRWIKIILWYSLFCVLWGILSTVLPKWFPYYNNADYKCLLSNWELSQKTIKLDMIDSICVNETLANKKCCNIDEYVFSSELCGDGYCLTETTTDCFTEGFVIGCSCILYGVLCILSIAFQRFKLFSITKYFRPSFLLPSLTLVFIIIALISGIISFAKDCVNPLRISTIIGTYLVLIIPLVIIFRKPVSRKIVVPVRLSTMPFPDDDVNSKYWSTIDVRNWIESLNIGSKAKVYSSIFFDDNINGKKLINITNDDLLRLNISKEAHRSIILNAIEDLKTKNSNSKEIKVKKNRTSEVKKTEDEKQLEKQLNMF